MRNRKKGLNRELILLYGAFSSMAGLGAVFFLLFFLNIAICSENAGAIVAGYSAISAILWVALLFRNC